MGTLEIGVDKFFDWFNSFYKFVESKESVTIHTSKEEEVYYFDNSLQEDWTENTEMKNNAKKLDKIGLYIWCTCLVALLCKIISDSI